MRNLKSFFPASVLVGALLILSGRNFPPSHILSFPCFLSAYEVCAYNA
jgi:hypothetical protein